MEAGEFKVKPVLIYEVYQKKEATCWRPWGGLQTKDETKREAHKIEEELSDLTASVSFPTKVLPLSLVKTPEDISPIKEELRSSDVTLIYAACGGRDIQSHRGRALIDGVIASSRWSLIFVRHRTGPLYTWYEIVHPLFLRRESDEFREPRVDVEDIIVDDYDEVLWRLRALYGLRMTLGRKVIATGGASGWGIGDFAAILAQQKWDLDIKTVPNAELKKRLTKIKHDKDALKLDQSQAEKYLSQPKVSLRTDKESVVNAFMLHHVFRDLMDEFATNVITVNECMTTIIPMTKTTACLPLSLINDKGDLAFCESDFVVIPAGILLHYISGRPVFLANPTYPHDGIVTVAHCTAPRRMSGDEYAKTKLLTHFESDYGAAPKVEFAKGQEITVVIPDFNEKNWTGFRGRILDNPSYPICRSQMDIEIEGDWRKLLKEMRGFHWVVCYGNYLREVGYALKKMGIKFCVA